MGFVQISICLLVFSMTLRDASGLKCVSCIHMGFSPEPPQGFPNIYKNYCCKEVDAKLVTDNSLYCPDDGNTYVCGTVNGMYTFDVPSVGISNVEATLRRCMIRPEGFEESSKEVCLTKDSLDKGINDINLIGAAEEFGDMTKFDGKVCYCNGDGCNAASSFGRNAALLGLLLGALAVLLMS